LYVGQVKERKPNDEKGYDYDFFMAELAEHRGVAIDLQTPRVNESMENLKSYVVFQDFMDLLPQISEANAISLELHKVCLYPVVCSVLYFSIFFCPPVVGRYVGR
jgi:hypothetical protein